LVRFFVPDSPLQFLEGPAGHAKVPAEVPEDSWVLRLQRLIPAAMLERWPQVCCVKTTCALLPTDEFVSTKIIRLNAFVN